LITIASASARKWNSTQLLDIQQSLTEFQSSKDAASLFQAVNIQIDLKTRAPRMQEVIDFGNKLDDFLRGLRPLAITWILKNKLRIPPALRTTFKEFEWLAAEVSITNLEGCEPEKRNLFLILVEVSQGNTNERVLFEALSALAKRSPQSETGGLSQGTEGVK
jgi:hypothetical protein